VIVKSGADIKNVHPELLEVLPLIAQVYDDTMKDYGITGKNLVVTSGCEGDPKTGPHGLGSRHYPQNCKSGMGEALDFRGNDLPATVATELAGMIARTLRTYHPGEFKIFLEACLKPNCHIHIQLVNEDK
jgi:hypothetical protein